MLPHYLTGKLTWLKLEEVGAEWVVVTGPRVGEGVTRTILNTAVHLGNWGKG